MLAALAGAALLLWWLVGSSGDAPTTAPDEGATALRVDDAALDPPRDDAPLPQPRALQLPADAAPPTPTPTNTPRDASTSGDVVHGRVLALPGERPLADAQVELLSGGDRVETWFAGARRLATARTSAEGRYRLEGLAAGRYRLRASAPHLATITSASFELDGSGATHELDLRLAEPGQLVGRVIDEDGAPVTEALAILHLESSDPEALPLRDEILETEVDERGVFVVDELAPGTWVVSARRIDDDLRRAIDAGFPGSMLPEFVEPGSEPPEPSRAEVPAGEPGEVLVVLPALREGRPCRLSGVVRGRLPSDLLAYEVEALYSTRPDDERSGTSLDSESVEVGADGRFVFDELPARATCTLTVHARRAAEATGVPSGVLAHVSRALPAGGDEWVEIELPPHGSVELSVVDAESGAPLEDTYLTWFGDGHMRGGQRLSRQPLTLVLPSGSYTLRPDAPKHELVLVGLEIPAGRAAAPQELRLARAQPWRPRLVGPDGAPLDPAPTRLALTSWRGEALGIAETLIVEVETTDGALRVLADQLHEGRFDAWLFDETGSSSTAGTLDLRRAGDTAIFEAR